jgi:hypothetical protein
MRCLQAGKIEQQFIRLNSSHICAELSTITLKNRPIYTMLTQAAKDPD